MIEHPKVVPSKARKLTEAEYNEKKLVEKIGKALTLLDANFLNKRPAVTHLLPKTHKR